MSQSKTYAETAPPVKDENTSPLLGQINAKESRKSSRGKSEGAGKNILGLAITG